jgi:methyl-accepting chemotaxis protein
MSEEKPSIFGSVVSMAGAFIGFGFVGWLLGGFVGCAIRAGTHQYDSEHLSAPFSAYVAEGVTTGIIAGIIAAVFPLVRFFRGLEAAAEERRAAERQRQLNERQLQLNEEKRVQKAKEAEEARIREAEQARKAEQTAWVERLRREKQQCREDALATVNTSLSLFEAMAENLNHADAWLDDAKGDFDDGAFAPFWDSIESAAKQLARFHENLKTFKYQSSRYTQLVTRIEGVPPQFPVSPESVARLDVARETAKRMKAMVRKAQCDFHFATIYEQRKTNKILIAGFTNLAQALEIMSDRISASIDDLAGSVLNLRESLSAIHARMGEMAETAIQHNEEVRRTASEAAERERKALELLEAVEREYRNTA